jgi:hypothetical protein
MDTVPMCLATAWVDLAGHEVLLFREHTLGVIVLDELVGLAITDLFQGNNVQRIERAFKRARGLPEDEWHYFQEIFIMTEDCAGIFIRSPSRPDRALAIITDRTVHLGMVLSRARSLMASTDPLP